jgi:coenzyme F420 hydrogenase subunit beta
LVVGDAWLPKFVTDALGNNVIVVRNTELENLIAIARKQNRIVLTPLKVSEIVASQAGGLRHRRDAISYRLAKEKRLRRWVPRKRIKPAASIFQKYERKRQDLRTEFRAASYVAFREARAKGDYGMYANAITPIYDRYRAVRGNLVQRISSLIRRTARRIP